MEIGTVFFTVVTTLAIGIAISMFSVKVFLVRKPIDEMPLLIKIIRY